MKQILVTGANGQLGKCLRDAASNFSNLGFHFATREDLDISDRDALEACFSENNFDYCINTGAYTKVDQAESEREEAFEINAEAVKNLAVACFESNTTLIQISTDYVFDGSKREPYLESDAVSPINAYGASKLKGEQYVQELCERYFIFRTSWLYSQYGHNFLNSMLRFAREGRDLKITTEQIGTPTNANDLAQAILNVIDQGSEAFGLYHYSNQGAATWYDFAEAIFQYSGQIETVKLAKTEHYSTFAKRPAYSILSNELFSQKFGIHPPNWRDSLKKLIEKIET